MMKVNHLIPLARAACDTANNLQYVEVDGDETDLDSATSMQRISLFESTFLWPKTVSASGAARASAFGSFQPATLPLFPDSTSVSGDSAMLSAGPSAVQSSFLGG
jgi:hypothetical protein